MDGAVKVFDLIAEHVNWEVLPGEFVDAFAYNGMVPGPVIRASEGDQVRINFTNNLPEPTVIHFHGPKLPNGIDGVADVTQKVNGKAFPATDVVEAKVDERVLIRLVNLGQMTHPMHMHGHPFKIVGTDRYPVPESQALTKDVINIGPGERYDLLLTADNPGTWLFHCHILTHVQNHSVEPGGMLTVVKVTE